MKICDLSAHVSGHRAYIDRAISRVIDSGWFVLGPEVSAFERAFAAYLGVSHCVSVANGTDALELALRSLGIKIGDTVATVANAGMYTSTALRTIGANPMYMDVDRSTYVASADTVLSALTQGAQAIVLTHLYGQAAHDIEKIVSLCNNFDVPLIEDCAQAHGAVVNGKRVGSFGDLACFSFYPTKNLGALGDGGAVVSNNSTLAENISRLRQYGWVGKYRVELNGRNSRLDEIQAAILFEFLPLLDSWNVRRRAIATAYSSNIHSSLVTLPALGKNDYVAHLYVIRCSQRHSLKSHLENVGIATEIHYPIPDHRQPVWCDHFSDLFLPNTELLADEILTLPCYPEMTDGDVQQVISAINNWQP